MSLARATVLLGLAALVALFCAACGSSSNSGSAGGAVASTAGATSTRPPGHGQSRPSAHSAAAWLGVSGPAPGWPVVRIPAGAQMPYPPTWHPAHGDAGTATAVRLAPGGAYVGYLNLTPQQGKETLANWTSFRVSHNLEEGDRSDHKLASASGLRFPTGTGSCVKDEYTTETLAPYIEVACLVAGHHHTVVIVGAAPPGSWGQQRGEIGRAILGVKA